MKTRLILFCIATFMTLAQSGPVFAGDPTKQFTAVVVVDGSPPRNWSMLLDATKNVYHSLEQGERILVFLVKDRNALLRVSTVKDSSVGGYADFCKLVDTLHHQGWPFGANPVSALKGPVYKHMLQRTKPDDRVMFIIVTEGRFSTRQAEELCDFADQIWNSFNWRLLLTGEVKKTPRKLILAASEGSIGWCKLSDALDPASIKKCIQEPRWFVTIDQEKAAKKPALQSSPQESEDQLAPETQPPKTVEPATPQKAKAPVDSEGQPPPASTETNSIVAEDRTGRSDQQAQKLPAKLSISAPEAWELNPEKEEKEIANEPEPPIDESVESKSGSDSFPANSILLWSIGPVSLIAVIVAFLAAAWARANKFQKKLFAPLANQPKEKKPTVLAVRVDSVVHRIGDIRRIKNFHIGEDRNNTIRLSGSKVASRHLRVFRRADNWFVRNLTSQPVVVNGRKLGRRRKCLLTLPAVVRITDDLPIELFLERSNKNSSPRKNGGPRNGK